MNEVEERALEQLGIIEQAYSIKIQNKKEVAGLIADLVDDKRLVLMICTCLNSWIAGLSAKGDVTIPLQIIEKFTGLSSIFKKREDVT